MTIKNLTCCPFPEECPPGKKTDDPEGRCCVFPFTYKGVSYDSCTTVANGHKPWCSFDAVYAGKWANCGKKSVMRKECLLLADYDPRIIFLNAIHLSHLSI